MRVLLVSKELEPFTPSGGIGTYTRILAEGLVQVGVETHILCVDPTVPRRSRAVDDLAVHTGPMLWPRGAARLTRLPLLVGRLAQAGSVWREYRRLSTDFDVVEAPELYAEGLGFALRKSVPLVIRLHSSIEELALDANHLGIDARLTARLEKAAARRAQIVISTAPHLAHVAFAWGLDPARTRAIIYPVRARPVATAPVVSTRVLFVGRLEARKNPVTLIEAAPRVLAALPDVRFRFIGSDTAGPEGGSHRETLEIRARQLGVAQSIEFVGALGHNEVFDEMAHAAVCAFPSSWESFGLVAAEAASIGRPVIVSDIPAFLDYVEDRVTGRVAAVGDPVAWSNALIETLQSPAHASEMGLRLRDEIAKRAAPEVVAHLTIEAYEAAIAGHSRGTAPSRSWRAI